MSVPHKCVARTPTHHCPLREGHTEPHAWRLRGSRLCECGHRVGEHTEDGCCNDDVGVCSCRSFHDAALPANTTPAGGVEQEQEGQNNPNDRT